MKGGGYEGGQGYGRSSPPFTVVKTIYFIFRVLQKVIQSLCLWLPLKTIFICIW